MQVSHHVFRVPPKLPNRGVGRSVETDVNLGANVLSLHRRYILDNLIWRSDQMIFYAIASTINKQNQDSVLPRFFCEFLTPAYVPYLTLEWVLFRNPRIEASESVYERLCTDCGLFRINFEDKQSLG